MNKYFFIPVILIFGYPTISQVKSDTIVAKKAISKADSLCEAGNYELSIVKYKDASAIYKKYNLWNGYFNTESKLADTYISQGKYDEAQVFIDQRIGELALFPKMAPYFNPLFTSALGQVLLYKGRTDLALEKFQNALDDSPTNAFYIAEIYNKLGVGQWVNGNTDLALEYQLKALNLRRQSYGEFHIKTAATYNNIGLSYNSTNPDKALEYYQKALNIYQLVYKDGRQPALAITYSNIGFVYKQKRDFNKALDNFENVLNIWTKIYSTNHPSVAFAYSNIGQIFIERGSYAKAQVNLQMALNIYLKYFGDKYPEVANTYNQLGNLYEKQQKHKEALVYFHKALIANSPGFNVANLYENPSALDYYNPNLLLTSLTLKSRALENIHFQKTLKRRDLLTALYCLETADTLLDIIRQSRTSKADKIALGITASEVYENGIKLCLALADVSLSNRKWNEKAFYFNEKSKSAVLLEAISETQAKNFAGIPDTLLERERQLKADIAFYEQKMAENAANPQIEKTFRERLFGVNRQYEAFSKRLEKQFPAYYNLKFNIGIATVADIQRNLDKNAALISYFNTENVGSIFIFLITKSKLKIIDRAKNPQFEKLIVGLRNSIVFNNSITYFETAHALYKQLLPKSPSVAKLIIVPDGKLGTIPFEALLSRKHGDNTNDFTRLSYLALQYSCSYEFSATLFKQAAEAKKSEVSKSAFFCAPVNFSQHSRAQVLSNLPGTETEVGQIGQLFRNNKYITTSYIGENATESEVKSDALKNFRYLHFATHGIVNESKPELSEIFLCRDTQKKEDGNLYSGEIYNLHIKADLVTLSACQTGLGKVAKGEGIIGLSRALLYAGAQNLVVSLWTVSDESTSMLMVDFYADLLKSENPDYGQSLRLAKLKLIGNPSYARPYFWAPFVLIGK